MYICLCHGVCDQQIKQAVSQQACQTMACLAQKLGVGTQCGQCQNLAQAVLHEALQQQ